MEKRRCLVCPLADGCAECQLRKDTVPASRKRSIKKRNYRRGMTIEQLKKLDTHCSRCACELPENYKFRNCLSCRTQVRLITQARRAFEKRMGVVKKPPATPRSEEWVRKISEALKGRKRKQYIKTPAT